MLRTERIQLRDYEEQDADFLFSLLADERMMRYIGNGQVRNEEEGRAFYKWIKGTYSINPDLGLKAAELRSSGERIGHAGLVPQTIDGEEYIEIGYWIAPDYWGVGLASETALALKQYGEQRLQLAEMICLIQPGNAASRKVAEKIGMRKDREIQLKGRQVFVFTSLAK